MRVPETPAPLMAPPPAASPGQEPGIAQPFLHDLVACVRAPGLALSGQDGQIREGGVQGVFRSDRRLLSELVVTVDTEEPVPLAGHALPGSAARFVGVLRRSGDDVPDPTVRLERRREMTPRGLRERITVVSTAQRRVRGVLRVRTGSDLAAMDAVKAGAPPPPVVAATDGSGLRWTDPRLSVRLAAEPPPAEIDPASGTMTWDLDLGSGGSCTVDLAATAEFAEPVLFEPAQDVLWQPPGVTCPDPRLAALVQRSLDDLGGLLLTDAGDPFLAAGNPWFLTLFGRDALWAARMLLPLGTDLALGTLRVLARRQGDAFDLEAEEAPGKILHEVRRETLHLGPLQLPPVYYGTVDATPLWVSLLADAWRWGADPEAVAALLPAAERALTWIVRHGDADGDGFLEYVDHSGHGLGNQGWKDSNDSVQYADGRLADAPIALCEVQAYAYAAALDGAALLEAYDRPDADLWREWAAGLKARFRDRFWVDHPDGAYPALALDAHKRHVDAVASNMGHLLGTGLLDREEAALVARRLAGPDMDSGFGLRTLTARSPRFGPLSYHGGSVWPHDTAIAMLGLAKEGQGDLVASYLQGLLAAAPAFDYRLPELFGGEQAGPDVPEPVPYPAACRPQAWAAAAGVALLSVVTGLAPDVPAGVVSLDPLRPSPLGAVTVAGLQVAGSAVTVSVDADGGATVAGLPAGLRVGPRPAA